MHYAFHKIINMFSNDIKRIASSQLSISYNKRYGFLQWLVKELALLEKKIERANEKGWRREYP